MAALVAATGCAAHLPGPSERTAFLERSYLSGSTDRRQAFEVDPALHVLLWNGLDRIDPADDDATAFATTLSFLGSFRMLSEASTPMRTPTYDPHVRFQLFRATRVGAGAAPDASGGAPGHQLLGAVELTVGHRSNGEQGCALADHVRTGKRTDFDCAPTTDPPTNRLNLESGSFTTNYLGAALRGRWMVPGGDGPDADGAGRNVLPLAVISTGVAAEWNVPCHFDACMPPEMRARYGEMLARATFEVELPEVGHLVIPLPGADLATDLGLRATLAGTAHLGVTARAPFGDASAELAVTSRTRGNLGIGLFVRRHQGRDDLNIRFEERLDAWMFGLVVDPAPAGGGLAVRPGRTAPAP